MTPRALDDISVADLSSIAEEEDVTEMVERGCLGVGIPDIDADRNDDADDDADAEELMGGK